jgi:uncharacterized membrane protein YdjX (TVP38/TMEM64 family)
LVTARRLSLFVVAIIVASLLTASEALHQQIVNAIDLAVPIINGHPVLGMLLFLMLAALSAMLMFFSSVVLVTVGVETWGQLGCLLLLWAGWLLGGLATYLVGRRFGRPALAWMLSDDVVARYESRIPGNPSFLTALLVQLALPSDVSGYFFGLVRYPAHLYLSGLMVAELPYAVGTVLLGEAFVRRQYVLLLGAAGAGLALLGVMWLSRRRA